MLLEKPEETWAFCYLYKENLRDYSMGILIFLYMILILAMPFILILLFIDLIFSIFDLIDELIDEDKRL